MAKPTTSGPPMGDARVAERDALLATKLYVPRPRPEFLSRARLLERLAEAVARDLTLVCTPAGFGKTTLLGEWARSSTRPVAWLSLDEGDNDPARFWRYVAAALDQVRPGTGARVGALLRGPEPSALEAVVAAVINELAAQSGEILLVLDDYHLIQAPRVHQSLEFLLEHLPASLRLVVASRADPPLPLARLRARGQLAELRQRDLRFTPTEAAALLRTAVGPELPEAAVAALAERTEGWVAGLQLAALSLRGHGDVTAFVEGFSGSHRYVLDYLAEEVLDRQPKPLRAFLLETSVLERLSGPLCAAVTGRAESQLLLERVERANLFLVPLDEERRWWRYHQLFADLLRARLPQEQPERVAELHRRAAAWSEAHGLVDDAVRHALAAGDAAWAAWMVEQHFDAVVRHAEGATLDQWLAALPAELVRSRPRLRLAQAVWALIGGRLDEVEPLLEDAERALAASGDAPYEPSVGRAASLVANAPASIALMRADLARRRGDAESTTAFGQRALSHLTEDDRALRLLVDWYLAVGDWLRGRLPEAEDALTGLVAAQRAAGEHYLAVRPAYDLGQVQRARGHLGATLRTYQQTLEIAVDAGRPLPPAGMVHVGLAEVLYERGELQAALNHASQGVGLCRHLAYNLPLSAGLAILAWIRHAQGDRAGAAAALREAERVAPNSAAVGLMNPIPALRARLALAHGEAAEAARWAKERGLGADDQPSYPREREYLVLTRVLLAERASAQALGLLERLHAEAAVQGRTGSVIEVRALQALARAAGGDQAGAQAALAEALVLGAPEGYLRVFIDEGPSMAALLHKLLRGRRQARPAAVVTAPRDYLARLVDAFEQAGLPIRPPIGRGGVVVPGLVEPLTARELEVLGLLADGKPNQTIAEELVVTLDTVKSHVTLIFDKLGAANRTQAVSRARELGLLR
jgi:LuxR family transcriptional regulator, maltose regulon positive regulatory protein